MRAVEAGIVEAVVDPERDRNQPRAAAGKELDYRDGARTVFVFLLLLLSLLLVLIGWLVLGAIADLRHAAGGQQQDG